MIDAYPFLLFIATGLVWVFTVLQNGRLLRAFRERYPQVAQREIPYAFEIYSHPEKAFFFYRRRAAEILRDDPQLWSLRRQFIRLSLLSVVLPVLGFLPLFIAAVILSKP